MKPKAITVRYHHFEAALTEWVDQRVIWRYQAEIFSLYSAGYGLREVADYLTEVARRDREL